MSQQQANAPLFTLKNVGPNVWAVIEPGGLSNSGFVVGDDGVVVIDSFVNVDAAGAFSLEGAQQVLAEIRKVASQPVKFVVNTHYHMDHVSGNSVFVDAGAKIVGQRNVREWMYSETLRLFGNQIKPEQKAFVEAMPAPVVTYDEAITIHLGSRDIQVRSFPGHTGSDSIVVVPDAKTVFAGDLFWRNTLPNIMDGSIKSWLPTLHTLETDFPDYTFIPGHGDVGDVKDVASFHEYLTTLHRLVSEAQATGKAGAALGDALVPELQQKYGEWGFFNFFAQPNILDIDAELRGTKRVPR
jgi:glyoxylase-like metal-dependent hydrolase (beta-lactamase superfamily II)